MEFLRTDGAVGLSQSVGHSRALEGSLGQTHVGQEPCIGDGSQIAYRKRHLGGTCTDSLPTETSKEHAVSNYDADVPQSMSVRRLRCGLSLHLLYQLVIITKV